MKNLLRRLTNKKVLASLLITAVTVVSASAVSMALLGGDRVVKQYQGPGTPGFDHVTFNSFTDVPNIGDERDFFHGKISQAPNGFYDPMNGVRAGDEILMRVYVHNNADPKHNADGSGVAKNTKVRVELPTGLAQSQSPKAFISADNAAPQVIEDTLSVTGEYPVQLQYMPGSATIKTNFIDQAVSDNIVSDGVLVGDDNVNGNMKGCFEYVALVTFKVKVVAPSYQLEKKVRLNGTQNFTKDVEAKAGDKVDFVLAFKNVGSTNLNNVVLGDRLPKGFTYVPGTTEWNSGHTGSKWTKVTNENLFDGGIDVGAYAPNGAAYIRFTAQVTEPNKLECGTNRLVNTGYAKPKDQGTIEDKSTVVVEKKCEESKEAAYACKLLTIEKSDGRTIKATVSHATSNGAQFKQATFDFGDGTQPLVTDKTTVNHTYANDGNYKVTAKLAFDVNGKTVTDVTGETCAQTVSFTTPGAPTELVKTGPADAAALFGITTVAGAIAHRLFVARRLASRG